MARTARMIVTGIAEIDAKLRRLGDPKIVRKLMAGAIRKGLKPVAAELKIMSPRGKTGDLAKSWKVRTAKKGKRTKNQLVMDVISVPDKAAGKIFYAVFVDRGTKTWQYEKKGVGKEKGKRKKGVAGKQKMKPTYFVEKVYKRMGGSARDLALAAFVQGVDQELAKK